MFHSHATIQAHFQVAWDPLIFCFLIHSIPFAFFLQILRPIFSSHFRLSLSIQVIITKTIILIIFIKFQLQFLFFEFQLVSAFQIVRIGSFRFHDFCPLTRGWDLIFQDPFQNWAYSGVFASRLISFTRVHPLMFGDPVIAFVLAPWKAHLTQKPIFVPITQPVLIISFSYLFQKSELGFCIRILFVLFTESILLF